MPEPTAQQRAAVSGAAAVIANATAKCTAHHAGPWMIEPRWFAETVDLINRGVMQPRGATVDPDDDDDSTESVPNVDAGPKLAVIPIVGPTMKARSKFGGTSTVDVRSALRAAAADGNVDAILLHIDSPGGTAAGTDSLARDVAAVNVDKPVYAHVEDCCCSAAYYVASQCRRITACPTSSVGSLGTRMSVVDASAAAAAEGLKIRVYASGPYKAAGVLGTEVTPAHDAYFQGIVDETNAHFKAAVAAGRGFDAATTDALFDGRIHDAATAMTLSLIDDVSTLDAAVGFILTEVQTMSEAEFAAYVAANPNSQALGDIQLKANRAGVAEGVDQERKRCGGVVAACNGNLKLAVDAINGGLSLDATKVAAAHAAAGVDAQASAEQRKAADDLKAANDRIATLESQLKTTTDQANAAKAAAPRGNEAASASVDAPAKGDVSAAAGPGDRKDVVTDRKYADGTPFGKGNGIDRMAAGMKLPGRPARP